MNLDGAVGAGTAHANVTSASRLLATGTRTEAVVMSPLPLGQTVSNVEPSADASRLDAPIWLFTLEVMLPGRAPSAVTFGHWVPVDKVGSSGSQVS